MELSKKVEELEMDVKTMGPIRWEERQNKREITDRTYEDTLATTIINKVNLSILHPIFSFGVKKRAIVSVEKNL